MRLTSLAFLAAAGIALVGCAGPDEPVIAIPGHAERDTDNILRLIDLSFTDGAYEVGLELEPGTYRTEGSAVDLFPSCNWKRFRSGGEGLVASGSSTGPTTIAIEATDGAFESRGCQPWVRVGDAP